MPNTSCPTTEALAAWVNGDLDESRADFIADHIDDCEICVTAVEAFEASGLGLLGSLRSALLAGAAAEESSPAEFSLGPLVKPSLPDRKRVGEYQILETLGQGGMGTVYRALHGHLRRQVALKVLAPRASEVPTAVARFEREMQVVGRLNHPNIVQAFDAGLADGVHYIAMELLDGSDLSQMMNSSGGIGTTEACEIVRQAGTGLYYAHKRGMVHRDVKPSNIMLSRGQSGHICVKLLDLGLAIMSESSAGEELTDVGQLMGTLEYMAPEQTEDTHLVDQNADIYALGATFYRLLTGKVPFGDSMWNTPAKRLKALLNTSPPCLCSQRPNLPESLGEIVDGMLSREPQHRPSLPDVIGRLEVHAAGHDFVPLLNQRSRCSTAEMTVGIVRNSVDTAPTLLQPTVALSVDVPLTAADPEFSWSPLNPSVIIAFVLTAIIVATFVVVILPALNK